MTFPGKILLPALFALAPPMGPSAVGASGPSRAPSASHSQRPQRPEHPEHPEQPESATPGDDDGLRAAARDASAQRGGARAENPFEALPTPEAWRALVARDARVAFTQRTAGEARAILALPDLTPERRAVALLALGASGAASERALVERVAKTGEGLERSAAILALGELGATPEGLFDEWIAKAEKPVAECALLALLRADREGRDETAKVAGRPDHSAGRRRVEEIAGDPVHPLSGVAKDLLVFALDPGSSRPTRAGALLLRLRWQAARQIGLVDGRGWSVLVLDELAHEPRFVREVVMGAAAHLRGPSAKDHVLQELLGGRGSARLRAAVVVMPRETALLVENDKWKPADPSEWSIVLDEISERHLERLTVALLRAATEVPEVRFRAETLLSQAGDEDLTALIGLDATKLTVEERVQVCAAIGARDDAGWLTRFAKLREDRDPRVRLAYDVAAKRLGSKKSGAQIDSILADPENADHATLVDVLCGVAQDPSIGGLLEDRLLQAEGPERVRIATALCLQGRPVGREWVRAALAAEPPPHGAEAVRLVRALRANGAGGDVEVLHALFPSEDDRALDLALATTLAELGDASVQPILRAAIWSNEFDLSLLACGLAVEAQGVRALRSELRVPPTSASSNDLRRVGFAIGEWGGMAALQDLARDLRYASGDPALQGAYLGALSARTQ